MCAGGAVCEDAYNFLVCFYEWLYVRFVRVCSAPESDGIDEVRVEEGVVEVQHLFRSEKFGCIAEGLDMGL